MQLTEIHVAILEIHTHVMPPHYCKLHGIESHANVTNMSIHQMKRESRFSFVPRPHPVMEKDYLVNHVEFFGLACTHFCD